MQSNRIGVKLISDENNWNAPFTFSKITWGANELAPKYGQRDDAGRSRIGLYEDELQNVIVDKVVKESTTVSNTGAIFRNSMNELFGI